MTDASVETALRELKAAVEKLRGELVSKDHELEKLRALLADREERIRNLGDQALHLLDLLHEARSKTK
ncbi:MAG: hypothetical protein ACKVS6_01080 [Planctomycetota bacterium]